ncbi:MAG: hypothetical protein A3K19_16550 [Lentisphaerae bacterium RIFOXYB12_FULL_65_16]|nr:MAG: hypothetical protein A3K18_24660 [Lentisphaerae bacterium RIFOXYA12_64_32]OGV89053.1 MAG: hypothetical protein A3K19_16550 [Lentisphaerae bacterium RIFOXYB12_FULL_65_16]
MRTPHARFRSCGALAALLVAAWLIPPAPGQDQDAAVTPVAVLQGAAARRLNAAPDDKTAPNCIRTGKETIEWDLPALPAGLYCFEMRVRTGNDDADPLNVVCRYRLAAVGADGKECAPVGFEPKPGCVPAKTSKQWPVYVGDIVSTAPLSLTEGMRLHVTAAAPWLNIDEVRLFPAPDRYRLSFGLTVAEPRALFRRGEPIQATLSVQSFWDAPGKVPVSFELISPYGKSVGEFKVDLDVPAGGIVAQPVTFTSSLNGCHVLRMHAVYERPGVAAFEYTQEIPVGVVSVPTADRLALASPFGVHPGGLKELYQSGFKWVRLWDSGDVWAAHEREGKGKFDFLATEEKVENFRRAGFEVLAVLAYSPTWASTHPEIGYYVCGGAPFPPKDIRDWQDYCREYMTRFKGRIRFFEVWNEPNTGDAANLQSGFFRGTTADYVALLKAAFEVSRQVDPEIRIVGCSGTGDFLAWTEAVLAGGGGPYMDVLSFHAYTTPSSPEEANLEGRLDRLHQIMEQHGVGKLPLWNTEVGYWQDRRIGAWPATTEQLLAKAPAGLAPNWTSNWPFRPIPEDDTAAFTVRHYYLNMAKGVERLFWYSSITGGMPLLCEDGSLRLSCFAVAAAAQELDGFTYWRRIDLGLRRLQLHLWESDANVKGIVWHADRGTRDVLFRSPAAVSAVDIWGNPADLARTADGVLVTAGRDPILITGPAEFFDTARLQARELVFPVDDAYVVRQVDPERPVKNHTSPAYHGDRRVFGLPSVGDTLGWKLTGIMPGAYQVEVELRTGDAGNLYGNLGWYEVTAVSGDVRTPVRLVPVDDPARQAKAITTQEGGDRAYGWARSETPVQLDPVSEVHVALKGGFGFVGSLALREQAAEGKPVALPKLASPPALDGDLAKVRDLPRFDVRSRRQVAIGVADPFASTSERDAWQGEKDLSAAAWAATCGDVLYVAVDVTDGGGLFPAATGPYNGDCIELFLDLRSPPALGTPAVGDGVYQLLLRAPRGDATETRLDGRVPPGATAVARKTAAGWGAEFLIPVSGLTSGRQLGFDLAIDDDDTGQGRKTQIVWHGTRENYQDPSAYGGCVVAP